MRYKFADFIIEYEAQYNMLREHSKKYLTNGEPKNVTFFVTEENMKEEMILENYEKEDYPLAEYMLIGSTFHKFLTRNNGFFLHSSAVVVDDEAYLFSAPCGTGKSTHTSLWLKYLAPKNPFILNDDKPAIRIFEDGIYAYGTPFSGKHDISENKKVKLKAICFLKRGETNSIRKLEPKEAIYLLLDQTFRNLTTEEVEKLLDSLEIVLKEIPIYELHCNMSEDAVKLSYETMKGEHTNES